MTNEAEALRESTRAFKIHNDAIERQRARAVGALANTVPVVVMIAWDGHPVRDVLAALAAQIGEDLPTFLLMDSGEAFRRLREQGR